MTGKDDWLDRLEKRETGKRGEIVDLDFILDGKTVSHVGIRERKVLIFGCWISVGSIGGVATKEEYRNRGLATRLMERAVDRIGEDGGDVMLVSGDRGLYRRLGCVGAGVFYKMMLSRDEAAATVDPCLDLRAVESEDMVHLVNLQQAEPVRWHRSLGDFRKGLEGTAAPLWRPVEPLLVERDGHNLAYILVERPKQNDEERSGCLFAAEYAGSRAALLSAAESMLEERGYQQLIFHVPAYDLEMLYQAKNLGISMERESLPGHTFKIVDLKRVMERFSPYIEQRLERGTVEQVSFKQQCGKFHFQCGRERLVADVGEGERIIFGPHNQGLKKRIPQSLRSLFPLPFPWPGLDSF